MTAATNSSSNLVTKLALYPIGFIASIWISRYLGPSEKGIFTYIIILTSFFIPIFSFGIGGGFRYYLSNKEYRIREVLFSVLIISILIGLTNGLLVFLFWWIDCLGETGKQISCFQITGIICIMLFYSIYFFMSRIAMGNNQFHLNNFFELIKSLLNPFFMVLFVYFLALRIDGVMIALVLLNFILAFGFLYSLIKGRNILLNLNYPYLRKAGLYGFKGWLGDVSVRANVRLDQLILGGVASSASLGIYAVGVTLVEIIWILPDSIGTVLFNRIAEEKDLTVKVQLTERIHRLLFAVSFVLTLFWALVVIFIIIPYGYGSAFSDSIIPFLILVPGSLLFITSKVTTKLLAGAGRVMDSSKATASGALVSIAFYFLLIPDFGIIGAAIASSLGYVAMSAFCLYYTKKYFDIDIKKMFILIKDDYTWLVSQVKSIRIKS